MAHTTPDGRFLQVNHRLREMLGYSGAELLRRTTRDLTHPDDRDRQDALRRELLSGQRASFASEKRYLRKDGTEIWVNRTVNLARRASTGEAYLIQVIEDISERKRTEARLARLTRARRVMAEGNHVLIHAVDDAKMLADMCRILVDSGGYKLAWVGFPTPEGNIRPAAHAGYGADAPMTAPAAWGPDGRYQGFMQDVIATGKPHIARDILRDPRHQRRYARALQHGFQSSIALPLLSGRVVLGAVAIYAREAEAFDAEEIALLGELAGDIAYGICNLRERAARLHAEAAQRESEQRFRDTFEQAAVGITRVDLNGVLVEVNQRFCDMLGYAREELLGRPVREITHPGDYGSGEHYRMQMGAGRLKSAAGEKRFLRKDGGVLWARRTMSTACDAAGKPLYVISVVEDISARKESEERYRATFDCAPVGIMHVDLERRILQVNAKLCDVLGYAPEELPGQTLDAIVHPDYRGTDRGHYAGEMLAGRLASYSSERRYLRKDGKPIWVNRTISLVRDAAGQPLYFVRVIEDITGRREAQAERARLAAIVDNSNDAIVSRDLERNILTWNPAAERLFGWTANEAIGRGITLIVPPERSNENAHNRALVHQGLPVPAYDTVRLTRDKRRIDVSLSQSAIKNGRGEVIAVSLVFHDIAARKELERRFRLTFTHAAVGMSLGSLDGVFVQVNRHFAEMLGYAPDELVGRPLAHVFPPGDRAGIEALRQKLLRGDMQTVTTEQRYVHRDGRIVWGRRTLSLARDVAGEPLYYISVVEDITESLAREARYRTIFDNAAIGITRVDMEGRLVDVNHRFCEMLGYTRVEVLGRQMADITYPEDRARGRRQMLKDGSKSITGEKRLFRKDGGILWVRRSLSRAAEHAGEAPYFISIIEDITQRKALERQFRDTFEQAAVGILHAGLDGRYLRVNRKLCEITGYTEEALTGPSQPRLSHPEDVESGGMERRRLLAGEVESHGNEKRYLRKDGAVIWVNRTESVARDESGEPLYFIRVIEDITQRRELERRFELTFSHAAVGMTQTTLDGRFLQTNRKFQEMVGYAPEELARMSAIDVTYPEDCAETLTARDRLLKGEVESVATEKRLVRRDGSIIWVIRSFSLARGATGEPLCFITVVEDITERKEAAERYRVTFENAPVGIMQTSVEDGRVLRVNAKLCDMLGYQPEELLGTVGSRIVDPDYLGRDGTAHHDLLAGKLGTFASERLYRRKDESRLWVRRTVSLARDSAGKPLYFIRIIEDITARKEAQEQIARERALLRTIIDTLPDFIYVKDADGRFRLGNAAWLGARGRNETDIVGRTVFDVFPREVAESMAAEDHQVMESGETKSDYEQRIVVTGRDGARGEERWSSTTKAPMRDASGAVIGMVGVSRDITTRKRTEAALREAEEQFRQLANNIPQVFWITDVGHRETIYISPAAAVLTGRSLERLYGKARELVRSVHPDDRRRVYRARRTAAGGGYDETYRVVRPDGTVRWVNDRAFPVIDEAGVAYRIAGIAEDVTDRKLAEERLRQLAHYDVLTNLPNRALFYDRLRQVLAQARRNDWIVAVMFVDLDRFKYVNDTLGHAVGDELLRQVSQRLTRAVRSEDTVGRLGGDEFAVLLSNFASMQDASLVAQKIMASFNEPFKLEGADFYVTVSIGVTVYPDDTTDQDALIKNADAAMYRAKELGRNNYQFYTSEMHARALEVLRMESDMRRALDRDEFVLLYQPKASIASGAIVGVEALLRWRHPERGLVAPGEFMSVLEETGLIVPVGDRVLKTVCRQLRAWQVAGIRLVPVAVNLSPRQFAAKDLGLSITRILREHDINPSLIELEITEGSLMSNTGEAVRTLEALGGVGIGLSIDDFGTGYSSLAYLKRFPLDALKIDRSFVTDITTDPDDATITRAVISMAHNLGLKVIAEGVETEAQLAFLAGHGCDEVQGYYFARPLEAEECGIWLREQRRLRLPYARLLGAAAMR